MAIEAEGWRDWKVVALAGGVGGAKLAHGLALNLPDGQLSVVVNVADDFTHYGLHISPDLDTVMYTLAELANPVTGWGLKDESWQALAMMECYGEQPWFRLGDRDLTTHILRTEALAGGQGLTEITRRFARQLGITQHLLPATDEVWRTMVETQEYGTLPFQHYFVKYRWQPTVSGLKFVGSKQATITSEVRIAFETADLIIICPSNPLLSIEPILALQGMRDLVEKRRVPCVVVSPLIGGKAVKGPLDKLMGEMGLEASALGIANYYAGLVDVLVMDVQDSGEQDEIKKKFSELKVVLKPTLMQSIDDRKGLARSILNYVSEVIL